MTHNLIILVQAGLSLAVVGLFVLLGQYLYDRKILRGEYSRKFSHMFSAAYIASWRYIFEPEIIVAMAVLLLAGVYLIKHLNFLDLLAEKFPILNKLGKLKSIYAVSRVTHGELSYAAAIGICAILFHEPAVFALCIVNLGFADGLAAVIGKKYSTKSYKIMGADKSFAGAVACFLFAVVSGAVFWKLTGASLSSGAFGAAVYIIFAALAITLVELVGQKGLDNLAIPVLTGIIFTGVI